MTVKWDKNAVRSVMRDPAVARELLADGWKVAEVASQLAPVRDQGSRGGAKSIRAEQVAGTSDDPEIRVSWDRAYFYMGFAELGTEHQPATPFLRVAAQRFK